MKEISFFAQGIPKGQPRPRAFARKMGDRFVARVYDAGTAEGWKSCVALAARPFASENISEPMAITMAFLMPRPKSHYKRGRLLRPDAPRFHSIKPDVDNLFKGTCDALKTIGVIADDSLIVEQQVVKLYASTPDHTGVQIRIYQPSFPLDEPEIEACYSAV